MSDFDKQYSRFPFIVLPYDKRHMSIDKEIIINYDSGIMYLRKDNNIIPISDSGFREHIEDDDNPHYDTITMVGLENVLNIKQASKEDFDNHVMNYNNPHRVTKDQIGLDKVPNIAQASKIELDILNNRYLDLLAEVEELLSRPEYQKLYELIIDTIPEEALARVFYDGKWNDGKIHNVPAGEYQYEVFMEPVELKYNLIINTNPPQSKVEVYYDDKWNMNKTHNLPNGDYEVRVTSIGYDEYLLTTTISNKDKIENIILTPTKYNLTINTIPEDCIVKVYYNTKFNIGNTHSLINGEYIAHISKDGYDLKEENIFINNDNKTITVTLDESKYTLTVNTIPNDAIVEVFYNDKWNIGNTHKLLNGTYDIRVNKDKYLESTKTVIINSANKTEEIRLIPVSYTLTVNTTPVDSLVEVYYNNQWNAGNTHNIPNGTYNIRVSKLDYITNETSVDILDSDKIVDISLELKKYNLKVNVIPVDSTVKVKIDGVWTTSEGNIFSVIPGNYEIIAEKEGYKSNTTIGIVGRDNINVNIELYQLHTLTINTTPSNAITKVKIDGVWMTGNIHKVISGSYEIECSLDGYYKYTSTTSVSNDKSINIQLELLKYTLTITTTPDDSTVSVYYNNVWNSGKIHSIPNGDYTINISKNNYFTQTHSVSINNDNVSKSYTLIEEKYSLTVSANPSDALIEVYYNGVWNSGSYHSLSNGYYNIKVSKEGYEVYLDTILINKNNRYINVVLVEISTLYLYDKISCGNNHTVFLMDDGSVKSVGYNNYGQLGLGTTTAHNTIQNVGIFGVKQIACGNNHTMFLMNDGTVKAVGYNGSGQLGIGNNTNQSTIQNVNISNVKQIACGDNYTMFLMNDGSVKGVGYNTRGQLGLGNTTQQTTIQDIPISNVKQIACGYLHTMFLMNDGAVKGVGLNNYGQLGIGNTTQQTTIQDIPISNVKQIACGYYYTMFLMNDGTVKGVGYNAQGQLGLGNTTSPTTIQTSLISNVKQIACGHYYTMVLMNDGTVKGVGYNDYGQLGLGNTTNPITTIQTSLISNVKQISCGYGHTMFLMNDGTIKGTGANTLGQLGIGTTDNRITTPRTIPISL